MFLLHVFQENFHILGLNLPSQSAPTLAAFDLPQAVFHPILSLNWEKSWIAWKLTQ